MKLLERFFCWLFSKESVSKTFCKKPIAWLFSCNPIFNISNDSNFGGPVNNNIFPHQARCSLFKISIGIYKIYILTYKDFHFEAIYILNLKELKYGRQAIEEINRNYYKEVERLEKLNNEQDELFATRIEEEKEFLKYLIENEKERIASSYSKLNLYTAVYIALIPIAILPMAKDILLIINRIKSFAVSKTSIIKYINDTGTVNVMVNLVNIVLYINIIYFSLNLWIFIFNATKIGGVNKIKYSSVKKDSTTYRLNTAYYYDWQNQTKYATFIVSLIKNIEEQMLFLLLMLVSLKIIEMFL